MRAAEPQLTNRHNTRKSFSQSMQNNYNARLQEIRDMRNEINLALDKLDGNGYSDESTERYP
ncbi:hypothetical protein DPMN_090346 [Dreissena polymorpha]|uniref:Uncharacterized protein n=1 Tax=Dreissena polymorpha TaxID=45954 RepID=A0A9D4QZP8_DREPO|nr:hypothetical protein DPMN_090346 [Dreissena polymorpha]